MGNHIMCQHCIRRRSVSPQQSKKIRILLVGLDNAGKTTAAKGLVGEPVSAPAPTLGFSRLELRRRDWTVELYDVGGGRGIRGIWRNYLAESHGLVFVVDASDEGRAEECRHTLHALLEDPRVRGKPVLVLANKQDEPSALDEVELNERLQLETAANQHRCPMRIELCSARLGAAAAGKKRHLGVQTGFNWLADYVIDNQPALEERVTADLAVRAVELEQQRWARDERVRRNREAAAAAAEAAAAAAAEAAAAAAAEAAEAAAADGGGDGGGGEDPVNTMAVAAVTEDAPPRSPSRSPASPTDHHRHHPDLDAAAGRSASPVPSTPASPECPSPPAGPPSPDTPLQPELEAQIQEVFTRTEMGRLVRQQAGRGPVEGAVERAVEGAVEGAPERAVEEAVDEAEAAGEAGGAGEIPALVANYGKVGGNGHIADGQSGSSGSGAGGGGEGGETTDDRPVVVHAAENGGRTDSREQSPDSPVLEKDSGQGSIKESDSETLMSSSASQLSAQANGVGPPRRRNRFFKRYTRTAPLSDDVLLTSLPPTPPTRNE